MAGRYEGMTAAEVVNDSMNHGFSLDTEDICKVQDIFGHTAIEELDRLANDIGRNNEYGEPDPNGTWGSGRRATRDTFYSILFHIWNWEDATRFWNEHTNPERVELDLVRKENDKLRKDLDAERSLRKLTEESKVAFQEDAIKYQNRTTDLETQLREAQDEIIHLKAKLYDLMMKEVG